MSYKAIHYFTDMQDFNHPYNVGDEFPRNGLKVTDARLKELSSKNNRQKKPLIALVADEIVDEISEKNYTKTDINRMTTAELQNLALEYGIENADEMTGGELKRLLIAKFSL